MIIHYVVTTSPHINENNLENRAALINNLYKKIGTKPWGTSTRRWRRGMRCYLNTVDPTKQWRVKKYSNANMYPLYCQAIDKGYPVILRFTFNFSKQAFASHHYVVGVGYRIQDNQKLVAVKDPDAGETNTGIHWIDWKQNEGYTKMLVISCREK